MKNGVNLVEDALNDVVDEVFTEEPSRKQKNTLAALQRSKSFSDIIGILIRSTTHRHLFIADLDWMLLPPLSLGQFRVFHDGKRPVAFASWARLSEESEQGYLQRRSRLKPVEWNSGDRVWLIDLVVVGNVDQKYLKRLIAELVRGPLSGVVIKMLSVDPKTRTQRVIEVTSEIAEGKMPPRAH